MHRVIEQFVYRRVFHDLSRVHHIDQVADLCDHPHVVGNDQNTHALFQAETADQLQDLGFDRHIQRGGRLICDQKLWLADHGHGDHHPLAKAAGELMRIACEPLLRLRDPDTCEHLDHPMLCLDFRADPFVYQQCFRHLPPHAQNGIETRHGLLKDHGDVPAADRLKRARLHPDQLLSVKQNGSALNMAGVTQQGHDRSGQHALTAAGLSHQADNLPPRDLQIDTVYGPHRT